MSRFRKRKATPKPKAAAPPVEYEATGTKRVVLETISPARAKVWLQASSEVHNRPVADSKVRFYAEEMKAGRWHESAQPIHFDENQKLMNGQHRLRAVVESGTTIKEWVAYGFPRELFSILDTGYRRSPGQAISMAGYQNGNMIAAMCMWMARYERGMVRHHGMRLSNSDALEVLVRHPRLVDSLKWTDACRKFKKPSLWGALHYIFSQKDQVLADVFFDSLATGQNMKPEDPTYILRERLLQNASARYQVDDADLFDMAVRTWNALRQGKKMSRVQVPRQDSDTPEVI